MRRWARGAGAVVVLLGFLVGVAPGAGAEGNEAAEARAPFPAVALGSVHSCAIVGDGALHCWGLNTSGQLGQGDVTNRGNEPDELGSALLPVDLGTGRRAVAVTAGFAHTCALLDDRSVKCWGNDDSGQLGLGDTARRGDGPGEMGDALPAVDLGPGRTAIAVSAGNAHTCVVRDDGKVACWGGNQSGQLGIGSTTDRGDGPGEMGTSLRTVSLGSGRRAVAVSAGGIHTCALLDDGSVKCWGWNHSGQLGVGDAADRGDAPGEMGDALPAVALGTGRTATAVSAGLSHTCALLDDGSVKCWGAGGQGRLGSGDQVTRGDGPGELGDRLPAVRLGAGRTATSISASTSGHDCAVLDDRSVRCWGADAQGQLGLGTTETIGDGPGEMGDALPPVPLGAGRHAVAVTTGIEHTCAVLDDGRLRCWGKNDTGQLGIGDTATRGDGAGELGDALPTVAIAPVLAGLAGTVTGDGSGAPVPGAWVALLDPADHSIVAGTTTDAAGRFGLRVAPGTYGVYVLDPSGDHVPHLAPEPVVLPAGPSTAVDVAVAPATGAILTEVVAAGSGDPVSGAWALVLSGTAADTGATELVGTAGADGSVQLSGLSPGDHYLGVVDPTGAHPVRFWPGSASVPEATAIPVAAGAAPEATVALPSQAAAPGGAALSGTVVEQGTGRPLAGARVIALRAADYALVRGAATDAAGHYVLDLPAGGYKLAFLEGREHRMAWFDGRPAEGLADAATVPAPGTADAALVATTGTIAGAVTDASTGAGVVGRWVVALGPTGTVAGAVTGPGGAYTLTGLGPGTYRVIAADPDGAYAARSWPDVAWPGSGGPVAVDAGATVTADLALVPG